MTPEMLIGAVVAVVAILGVVSTRLPKRKPPSPPSLVFRCGRCGAVSRHNNRTTNAWRDGKTKFFCQACHAKWLQSHPPQPQRRESYAKSADSGNPGCLGVVVLFALLPLAGLLAWAYT